MPPKSQYPGVNWQKGMWVGNVRGVVCKTANKGQPRRFSTKHFKDELECVDARKTLKQHIENEYWAERAVLAAADSQCTGLQLGPPNASDATRNTVYWRPNKFDLHAPRRVVAAGDGKRGIAWKLSCRHGIGTEACARLATQHVIGGSKSYCRAHAHSSQAFDEFCLEALLSLITDNTTALAAASTLL